MYLDKNSISVLENENVTNNHLEALKALSKSMLREVELIQKAKKTVDKKGIDLPSEVESYEKSLILSALLITGGNQRKAAQILNLKVTTLNVKIKRFGIMPKDVFQE
jgi:transcriptional regulator with GAF, ATPase, and Fis domain